MRRNRHTAGFSLLELVAVVVIIGIVASVVLSRVSYHAHDAKKKSCLQYKGDINTAIELFRFETGSLPGSLDELEGTYYPEAVPSCPVTNLEYQIDAISGRITGHEH